MNLLKEQYLDNRKKVQIIERWITAYKNRKLSALDLKHKLSTILSKLTKTKVPIYIIDKTYPHIFINADIEEIDFKVTGLYISEAIIDNFSPGETTAAILHYTGVYIELVKNPDLVKWLKRHKYNEVGIPSSLGLLISVILRTIQKIQKSEKSNKLLNISIAVFALICVIRIIVYFIASKITGELIKKGDSFAIKMGYGKELISFISKYEQSSHLYGKETQEDIIRLIKLLKQITKAIEIFPSERERTCNIAKEIVKEMEKTMPKTYYKSKTYEWAVLTMNMNCNKKGIGKPTIPKMFTKNLGFVKKLLKKSNVIKKSFISESTVIDSSQIKLVKYNGPCDIPGCPQNQTLWMFADKKYKVYVNDKFIGYVAVANHTGKKMLAIILKSNDMESLSSIIEYIQQKFNTSGYSIDIPDIGTPTIFHGLEKLPNNHITKLRKTGELSPEMVRYVKK